MVRCTSIVVQASRPRRRPEAHHKRPDQAQLGLIWRTAMDSMRELNQLLAAHPDLLAHDPPAMARDFE